MKFTLFTPHHQFPSLECDSVKLNIADSTDGKFSGSYGIRKGHANAVFSLSDGIITVGLNGQKIFSAECGSGFATVENDDIRVVVDSADEK
jgi:F0F1-type ATP synthase epsilon subunit